MNEKNIGKKSNKKEILKLVKKMCMDIADELNFELVDMEYVKEFGSYFLRVYIHKDGGVSTDDCEKMSERLSTMLDENDPITEAYYLEVSSPGLDRPLKTDRDLKRNLNKDIEMNLYRPINNIKKYEGKLLAYDDKEIKIEDIDGNVLAIPREAISIVRLAIKF